jgi:prephenate dehydrogenase
MTPAPLFRRVVIAGVGLIGGSLGLALRERRLATEVVGFGRGRANLEVALERGAIDRFEREPERAAERADLLVLAAPVRALAGTARALVPHLAEDAVVTDAGSVKARVVAEVEPLVAAPRAFVGAHPIAGTERSGAAAAFASLFEGERCILTPTGRTPASALTRVRALWEGVGMRVEVLSPEAHDRLLALVSHLPHAVAWALVGAIEGRRVDGRDPLPYSGGGLRDTTRIASSHPEMWRDIFLENREECLRAIDGFTDALATLRRLVASGEARALERELERLRTARGRIPRVHLEKVNR